MPDISMCKNEECPLRDNCYRFTATPSEPQQAYADFKPTTLPNGEITCRYFLYYAYYNLVTTTPTL